MSYSTDDLIVCRCKSTSDYSRNLSLYGHYLFIIYLLFIGNAYVGFYRGIGRVDVPFKRTSMHVTIRIILSYLLIGRYGLAGVALACGACWIFVNIYQTIKYKKLDLSC